MGGFYRNVLYPAYHWVKRDGVNRARWELERNQWRTRAEVLAIQEEKLTKLLEFGGKTVPYYRTLFRESGIDSRHAVLAEEFRRIPLLTKEIIRRKADELVSEDLRRNRLLRNSTSGSTGEPTRFYTDSRSTVYRKAAELRSDLWTGWRLGDRFASLWGAQIDMERAAGLRGLLHRLVSARRSLSSYNLSAAKMDEYVDILQRFSPVLLLAYPGPLEQFAIHCGERGVTFPSLKGIVSSAETLWPHQRELAEKVFGVKIFNRYGSREVGQIGSECEVHEGLHISADRLLVEVVDDDGHPCSPGTAGRILVTDLDNFGMPLIRYDIGDRGVPTEKQVCSCGRGLPLLQKVEGRTMDIIRTPGGHQIGGTFWTIMLRSRPGLKQFQIVQERLEGIVIHFVRGADYDRALLNYLEERIQEYCGRDFNVKFVEEDFIELTLSGKQRMIVSEISDQSENVETETSKD